MLDTRSHAHPLWVAGPNSGKLGVTVLCDAHLVFDSFFRRSKSCFSKPNLIIMPYFFLETKSEKDTIP